MMYEASSDARNSAGATTSCMSASRRMGVSSRIDSRIESFVSIFAVRSVATYPGHSALTRTRREAHSRASVRVSCMSPALDAPYAESSGLAAPPRVLATLTIEPPDSPRAVGGGMGHRECADQVDVDDLCEDRDILRSARPRMGEIPAAFTSTVGAPNRFVTTATARRQLSGSLTSAAIASARSPISAATISHCSWCARRRPPQHPPPREPQRWPDRCRARHPSRARCAPRSAAGRSRAQPSRARQTGGHWASSSPASQRAYCVAPRRLYWARIVSFSASIDPSA